MNKRHRVYVLPRLLERIAQEDWLDICFVSYVMDHGKYDRQISLRDIFSEAMKRVDLLPGEFTILKISQVFLSDYPQNCVWWFEFIRKHKVKSLAPDTKL